eukprot:gene31372-38751_t
MFRALPQALLDDLRAINLMQKKHGLVHFLLPVKFWQIEMLHELH